MALDTLSDNTVEKETDSAGPDGTGAAGQQQNEALEHLAFLTETATGLLAGSDPIERVRDFFQRFSDRLGLEIFVQYNVAPDGAHLDLNSWAGIPEKYLKLLRRLEFGQAVCGTVAQNRQPIYVNNVQAAGDRKTALIRKLGIDTYACHPLIVRERLLGTLSFGSRSLKQFDPQTIYLLRAFCQMVAFAMERNQAGQALEKALKGVEDEKNRLLAVMKALPIGLAIYDQNGADVLANHGYEEIWGSPRPPVRSFEDYPAYKAWWADSGRPIQTEEWASTLALQRGETVSGQVIRLQGFDGVQRIVLNSGAPIRDAQGQLIGSAVAIMDITERKHMEEALAESERRYRELIQFAPSAIYQIDFRTGRFTSVNDSMCELSGYSREELLQMTGFDLLDDAGKALFQERIRRWMSGEQPDETVEYRVRARDGHIIYAMLSTTFIKDENGRPLGATVIGHDVTARKLAEISLQESEQRFRSSIETLNEGFVILSAVRENGEIVDFRYEYANQVACQQARRPIEQVMGRMNFEVVPEYKTNGLFDQYVRVMETGRPLQARFFFSDEAAGEPFAAQGVFDIHASKFGDGLIVTSSEVTEQVRLEAENRETRMEVEIHHRLAEQREKERQSYARDIHDGPIQTLASLGFSLQLLKEAYPDPKLQLELSQIAMSVKGAVQELRELMNELRPPTVIRFGLAKAIQMHIEGLVERYPQIIWNVDLDDDGRLLPEQTCLALFRIYQEAINNITRHSEATQAWICYRVRADHVALEMIDNGKGFENNRDIIDLTKHQHFGLAGIAERVDAINGQLEITSQPGGGTTILVRVPVGE